MNQTAKALPCVLAASLLLVACGSTPDRRALYLPPPERTDEMPAPIVRVELPRHVDHRSLRVRATDQRLRTLTNESWAESPVEGFERLLAERLASRTALAPDTRIEVRFYRFEREADGVFRAFGHWSMRQSDRDQHNGAIRFERPVADADAGALVAAMSAAAATTADAIGAATADE